MIEHYTILLDAIHKGLKGTIVLGLVILVTIILLLLGYFIWDNYPGGDDDSD